MVFLLLCLIYLMVQIAHANALASIVSSATVQVVKVLEAIVETIVFIYFLDFAFSPLKVISNLKGLSSVTWTGSWHFKGISLKWITFIVTFGKTLLPSLM